MKKRTVVVLVVSGFLIASAVGVVQWQLPKVEEFAAFYIRSISDNEKIPVRIDPENLQVFLFPPHLSLQNIDIKPKKDLAKTISPVKVGQIEIYPGLLDLLIGKFWIDKIFVENAQIEIKVDTKRKNNQDGFNLNFSKILSSVPISEILLTKTQLRLNIDNKYQVATNNFYLKAYNQKNSLLAKIKEPQLEVTQYGKETGIDLHIDSQFMLTQSTVTVSKLKVIKDKSFIIGSGSLQHDGQFKELKEARFSSRMSSQFSQLNQWINIFHKSEDLDLFRGAFKIDLEIDKKPRKEVSAKIRSELENFQIGKVKLGDVKAMAETPDGKSIHIPNLTIELAGEKNKATIKNTHLQIGADKSLGIEGEVDISRLQLKSFLRDSQIADIPVWLIAKGQLKCKGGFSESLRIECPGQVSVSNVKIASGKATRTIVAFDKASAKGKMVLTDKQISYEIKAETKLSQGSSSGVIDFEKGFDIKYQSPKFYFSDIGQISQLDFAGTTSIAGQTSGNSRSAIFNMAIEAENFEFTSYFFGNLKTKLNYKSGVLTFANLDGNLESTRYKGGLDVDLRKERIRGDLTLPFFRMKDIQQAVIKKLDLKNRFLGSGSGKVKIDTPFDSDKLSFDLKARLFKGQAFGETFDEAIIEVDAQSGNIDILRGQVKKEKTRFLLNGRFNMALDTNFKFKVFDGDLKNSFLIRKNNLPASGDFVATGKITGKLSSPFLYVKADVSNFTFNSHKYGGAKFTYNDKLKNSNISFNIEDSLEGEVTIPKDNKQEYLFDLETDGFDVAPLVGFAIAESPTQNYRIRTSGEVSGHIDPNSLWNSEFSSMLKKVVVSYKGNKIETQLPTNIELKNNSLHLNEFKMVGERQHLSVNQTFSGDYASNFVIDGRINISFFKLFAPFIERIDGYSTVRLELNLKRDKVKLIGSSFTNDAYIQFPKFPHPFESMSADILFNQNKISINSITGRMAGGKVLGNGEFLVLGPKDYKLEINMNMEKINLNFPEGVETTGDAKVVFSGSGTPFNLVGKYKIEKGFIEKEFEGSESDDLGSDLLPQLLKKNEASPIILDLDVDARDGIDFKNTLVDGNIFGQLKVYGKVEAPRMKGSIRFGRTSRLRFRDTEFEITGSNFTFRGENPMNPALYLTAETRLQSYDINMLLQGTASVPKIALSSQPPLTEKKIISLLAFGIVSDELEDDFENSQNDNQQSTLQIGTSLLSNNPLGREIKDRLGWDIQFSSAIDDETSLAVPKITVSKKFYNKIEASVNRQEGQQAQTDLILRYQLDDNISTILQFRRRDFNEIDDEATAAPETDSQIGVDLEYKVEFK